MLLFNKNSTKNLIFNYLLTDTECSIGDIKKHLLNNNNLKISYQGIRRILKDFCLEEVIVKTKKGKYSLNLEKIQLISEQLINYIEKNRINKTEEFHYLVLNKGFVFDNIQGKKHEPSLIELIEIYKEEFNPHNIFQKDENFVLNYLLDLQKEQELIIFILNEKVIGGSFLVKKWESIEGNHETWKLKHFALKKTLNVEEENYSLKVIEKRVITKKKSIKLQVNLSEKEIRYIEILKRNGFFLEAELADHYRQGEKMYIYSKQNH